MALTTGDIGNSASDNTVVGVYDNFSDAESAVQALLTAGFNRADVQLNPDRDDDGTSSAGTSTSTSDVHSGIRGFFYTLFGGDENAGHHDTYAESVRRGSYVLTVTVNSETEIDRATDIMNRFNAVDIDERVSHWKKQGWTGYDTSAPRYTKDEIAKERAGYASLSSAGTADSTTSTRTTGTTTGETRIPVIEEQLQVGKREVQRGGVRVHKRIREVPVNETVQLRDEEIKVERRPVDKPATQADLAALKDGAIELRETDEEAVVSKTARVVEEVVIGKETTQRTEDINDTVRRTDVEVEQLGAGAGTSSSRLADDEYRRHWQSTYGASGGRYEDYDAAYRYGTTMAGSDRYKNYQWSEVEPQLRSDWESNHPGSTWDKVKDAVRYGAERVTQRRH
ncbi:YsnF/AvaK domain-containing protein [Noviherbaspirillum malthae]|uniref:YsnF/AvaK domain-containing protein n=1 Tax=Noviherbaspirillum malthae TaxID=1260987 RepID=UPI001E3C9FA7|nr:YsnF/AvaK domain-containing protein [Noviherbaspirillum malthae]